MKNRRCMYTFSTLAHAPAICLHSMRALAQVLDEYFGKYLLRLVKSLVDLGNTW